MLEDKSFPVTFTRTLMQLTQHTRTTAVSLGLASCLLLPVVGLQGKGISKLLASVVGLGASAIGYVSYLDSKRLQEISLDLGLVERKQSISWYTRLLQERQELTIETQQSIDTQVISDVVSYWQAQDKHLLIVGGTGAGKSTFVQAFTSVLGVSWSYQIYDTDCTVDDWSYLRSLPTCAMYESFADIGEQMQADVEVIEQRTIERKQAGNKWQTNPMLTIAEEMPALVDEIDCAGDWLRKHAKRGRRVKRFVAVVAQNDTIRNLGLEGDSKVRDSCFVRVYLGQSTLERAQQLKNEQLEQWLRDGGKQVCLVDDKPALRPTSVQTQLQLTSPFSPSSPLETPEIQSESQCSPVHEPIDTSLLLENQPLSGVYITSEQVQALKQLYSEGWSIPSILEQKLGQKRGGSWAKKREWLEKLLS